MNKFGGSEITALVISILLLGLLIFQIVYMYKMTFLHLPTGPTGPTGPITVDTNSIGPTGPTGSIRYTSGDTGSTGATGPTKNLLAPTYTAKMAKDFTINDVNQATIPFDTLVTPASYASLGQDGYTVINQTNTYLISPFLFSSQNISGEIYIALVLSDGRYFVSDRLRGSLGTSFVVNIAKGVRFVVECATTSTVTLNSSASQLSISTLSSQSIPTTPEGAIFEGVFDYPNPVTIAPQQTVKLTTSGLGLQANFDDIAIGINEDGQNGLQISKAGKYEITSDINYTSTTPPTFTFQNFINETAGNMTTLSYTGRIIASTIANLNTGDIVFNQFTSNQSIQLVDGVYLRVKKLTT